MIINFSSNLIKKLIGKFINKIVKKCTKYVVNTNINNLVCEHSNKKIIMKLDFEIVMSEDDFKNMMENIINKI